MRMIRLDQVSKNYGNDTGVMHVSMHVRKGERYACLGMKKAGKTTLIKLLMGFIKSDQGNAYIRNRNCWNRQKEIQKSVGYYADDMQFPRYMKVSSFLQMMAKLRHMKYMQRSEELLQMLSLDPDVKIHHMSKSMKQKLGLLVALMHSPEVLLLDGEDMCLEVKQSFHEIMQQEQQKGTTIFMTANKIEDVETIATHMGFMNEGKLYAEKEVSVFQQERQRIYKTAFYKRDEFELMCHLPFTMDVEPSLQQVTIHVRNGQINELLHVLSQFHLKYLQEETQTLKEYIMGLSGGNFHA